MQILVKRMRLINHLTLPEMKRLIFYKIYRRREMRLAQERGKWQKIRDVYYQQGKK